MRRYLDFYLANMKISVIQQFQYRVANYFYMIGMVAEPVIYLVVWSTVAESQGGEVGGYTRATFAAYYIVWTLVRNINIVLTPYAWEGRIQRGWLASELLRPIHPLHNDISYFAGWKIAVIVYWIPLAVVLSLIFKPDLSPTPLQALVFFISLWGAFLIRTMLLSLLGMITFWTTRVSAIFELLFAAELILSGKLVPLSLLPDWVRRVADLLPFQWTFAFPIETLIGFRSNRELLTGMGMQLFWILVGVFFVNLVWKHGIRRFSSVGN